MRPVPVSSWATSLPPRLTTAEVCALGRISPVTLWRRLKAKTYAFEACDRGQQKLYDRDAVLKAFGMIKDEPTAAAPPADHQEWNVDPDAISLARARRVRGLSRATSRRDVSDPVRGSGQTTPLRLVSDDTPTLQGEPA